MHSIQGVGVMDWLDLDWTDVVTGGLKLFLILVGFCFMGMTVGALGTWWFKFLEDLLGL